MSLLNRSKRSKKGFTLMETITVVVIIGVIAAFAIPAAAAMSDMLHMLKLDSTARQIYAAAQNRITAMALSEGTDKLKTEGIVVSVPSDFSDTGLKWNDTQMHYAASGDDTVKLLLPEGAIEEKVRTGDDSHYIIEYIPDSGMIYGVFYSDKEFDYSSVGSISRDKDARMAEEPMVGYYGGGAALDWASQTEISEEADIEVLNEEILALQLKAEESTEYVINISSVTYPHLYKEYKFKTSDGIKPTVANSNIEYDPARHTYTILLDSMTPGKHFADIFRTTDGEDDSPITPGDNIKISVKAVYYGGEAIKKPSETTLVTNSLFESRINDEVTIACGRHLQNLEPRVSNVNLDHRGIGVTELATSVTSAVLTRTIDWADYAEQTFTGYGGSTFESGTKGKLLAITNTELQSFDGGGLALKNLVVEANGTEIGLFGKFAEGGTIANTLIEDPVINSIGIQYVGALLGSGKDVTLNNCEVRLNTDTTPTAQKLNSCGVYATINANSYVGGLVGYMDGGSISDCVGALPNIKVSGNGDLDVGGLVGQAKGANISKSFANTGYSAGEGAAQAFLGGIESTINGRTYGGGLVGRVNGSTANRANIKDCYALGNIKATTGSGSRVGGLAGNAAYGDFSKCYAATFFAGTANPVVSYGFTYAENTSAFAQAYYLDQVNPTGNAAASANIFSRNYVTLKTCLTNQTDANWTKATENTTRPYAMEEDTYPLPKLVGAVHYGDWPYEQSISGVKLAYYEKHAGSGATSGYSYFWKDFDVDYSEIYTGSKTTVAEDGYVFLVDQETYNSMPSGKKLTVQYSGGSVQLSAKANTFVNIDSVRHYTYFMPPNHAVITQSIAEQGTFYHTINIGGTDIYYFNPDYGRTAINGAETRPADPANIIVRTARHLDRLSETSGFWGKSFLQERNIDFEGYTYQTCDLDPIGNKEAMFTGAYDGGGNRITGIDINRPNEDYVGLFGMTSTTAKLANIVFVSDFDRAKARVIAGKVAVGGLVGENRGTIDNCAVAGFEITGNNTGNNGGVGGFVGTNEGTITKSSADNGYFTDRKTAGGSVEQKAKNGNGGGFVGKNTGNIESCYALAKMYSDSSSVFDMVYINGFVGRNQRSGEISDSYCAVLAASRLSPQYRYMAFANALDQGNLNSCYHLSDGSLVIGGLGGTAVSYAQLQSLDIAGMGAVDNSYRYSNQISKNKYPFPAVVTVDDKITHYGNWPAKDFEGLEMAYYEIYREANGSYTMGMFNQDLELNNLSDNKTVVLDGYVLLFPKDSRSNTSNGISLENLTNNKNNRVVTLEWMQKNQLKGENYLKKPSDIRINGAAENVRYSGSNMSDTGNITVAGKQYYPRFLNPSAVVTNEYVDSDYYSSFTLSAKSRDNTYGVDVISERTFFLNPHFAKSKIAVGARDTDEEGNFTLPETVSIRTERHFATLAKNAYGNVYWKSGMSYIQERDLTFGEDNPYSTSYDPTVNIATLISGVPVYKNHIDETPAIGNTTDKPFRGNYDGNGKSITNLTMPSTNSDYRGMFGCADGAVIKNIKLINPDINYTAKKTGSKYLGALVGYAVNSDITNATIENPKVYGRQIIGGAIGRIQGNTTVSGINVTGGIIGAVRQIGGAIGYISNESGEVNINNITVSGNTDIESSPTTESYNIGPNDRDSFGTGGFIGVVALKDKNNSAKAINIRDISIAGDTTDGIKVAVQNNPGDTSADGGYHAGGGLIGNIYCRYNTADLNMSNFSAKNVSVIARGAGTTSFYGMLAGQIKSAQALVLPTVNAEGCAIVVQSATPTKTGTSVGGYVGTITGDTGDKNTKATATNQLNIYSEQSEMQGVNISCENGAGSNIGGVLGYLNEFTVLGSTNADGTIVNGAVITGDGGTAGGFVGRSAGSVSGFTVDNVKITDDISGGVTGGFAGLIEKGEYKNCDIRLTSRVRTNGTGDRGINGTANVGGFAGIMSGGDTYIENCFAAIPVTGNGNVGGFVGNLKSASIEDCYASGNVSGTNAANIGGFVGYAQRSAVADPIPFISSCYATGNVSNSAEGTNNIGGFIGNSDASNILSAYSKGRVTIGGGNGSSWNTGGFIGRGTNLERNLTSENLEELKTLSSMATFYSILKTTKVVNRVDSTPTLDAVTGELDYSNCETVYEYVKGIPNNTIDSTVKGDADRISGVTDANGIYIEYGATTYNVTERMKQYPELQRGIWTAAWNVAEEDFLIYWCLEDTLTTADRGKVVNMYMYSNKKNEFYKGTMKISVKDASLFGAAYPVLDPSSRIILDTLSMVETSNINGTYLYKPSGYNYAAGGNGYKDWQFAGIENWTEGQFGGEINAAVADKQYPKMVRCTQYYSYEGIDTFNFPTLTGVGNGITNAVHWGN